jgi:hypothetical protein
MNTRKREIFLDQYVHVNEIKKLLRIYYETTNRDLKRRLIYECRCDERIQTKSEGSTRLTYTEFLERLEHLKI